jgi:hypothetical protein
MANIVINSNERDMQLHIDKARIIIDNYLPSIYVEEVLKKLPKGRPYSKKVIRNVRANLNNNIEILTALVEVAKENKSKLEKFKELTT